ncbi:hypothetical protein LXL04_020334 [Taraxacum kok-saghyz]
MRSPVNKQDFMKLQVENLKALLEIESQVPLQQQQLLYNGKEMGNAETLSRLGVTDGDLVMMVSTPSSSSSRDRIWFMRTVRDQFCKNICFNFCKNGPKQWFALFFEKKIFYWNKIGCISRVNTVSRIIGLRGRFGIFCFFSAGGSSGIPGFGSFVAIGGQGSTGCCVVFICCCRCLCGIGESYYIQGCKLSQSDMVFMFNATFHLFDVCVDSSKNWLLISSLSCEDRLTEMPKKQQTAPEHHERQSREKLTKMPKHLMLSLTTYDRPIAHPQWFAFGFAGIL